MFRTRSALRWSWQRHAPKSRLLSFKGTLKREPEMRNPGKSHADWSWNNLKFQIFIHQNKCHIELQLFVDIAGEKLFSKRLWHRMTSAEAPGRRRPWRPPRPSRPAAAWRSPRGRWVLHSAAESDLSTAGVGGTRCGSRLWAPGPSLSRAVHGRALRQEKGDDRRVVVGCCRVQRGEAAASPGLEELVEAAPVAAQVAPHRRQVAIARRHGDVVVSAREMQQKWSSSVPLIFMFYLF